MKRLAALSPRRRAATIVAVLPHAAPDERAVLAAELVQAALDPDWTTRALALLGRLLGRTPVAPTPVELLSTRWPLLDGASRQVATSALADTLARAAERLAIEGDAPARAAAAELIASLARAGQMPLLARLSCDGDASVREAACEGLAALARASRARRESWRNALERALVDSARAFPDHRERGALRALLEAPRPWGPTLSEFLRDHQEPAHLGLRAIVRTDPGPRGRARAVQRLATPSLSRAAGDRLCRRSSAEEHAASLALAPLLLTSARRAPLAQLRMPARSLPTAEERRALDAPARGRITVWARALVGAGHPIDVPALAPLVADAAPATRLRLTLALGRAEGAPEREALRDLAFDSDSRVACAALGALRAPERDESTSRTLDRLTRSPHAAVRARAAREIHHRAWLGSRRHDSDLAVASLRLLLNERRAEVLQCLAARFDSSRVEVAVAALNVVARLGLVHDLEGTIIARLGDLRPRVAATAATALGRSRSVKACAALREAARREDLRVRANAVESLGRVDPGADILIEALHDPGPRVRANAVFAALSSGVAPQAADELIAMLRDERAPHRVSALWVASRRPASGVASAVSRLVQAEEAPEVRVRAVRAARRLLHSSAPAHDAGAPLEVGGAHD